MPGPYYQGNGTGFLTDYSNMAAAGSAFQGFASAYQDAQDKQMKRQEQAAQIEAVKAKMQREQDQTQIDMMKQSVKKDASGNIVEAPNTPAMRGANQLKAFGEGAKATGFDENGNAIGYEADRNSPKYIQAQNSGLRGQVGVERLGFNEHKSAVGAVADDKPTKDLLTGYQSINNAVANFKASGGMPQEFHQLQTALRLNAGSGNRTGVEERSKGYAHDWGISADEVRQIVTGNISDVALSSPKMVKAIIGISEAELANKQQQAAQQIKKKAGMYGKVYQGRAKDYKDDFDDTVRQQYSQFDLDPSGKSTKGLIPQGMVGGQGLVGGAGPAQDAAMAAKKKRLDELRAKAAGG